MGGEKEGEERRREERKEEKEGGEGRRESSLLSKRDYLYQTYRDFLGRFQR